jgi:enamine deaminase RidA (YjgF/YER057c/UK114 family)
VVSVPVTYANPPGLPSPIGLYSHVARVAPGGLVFVAGQLAVDRKGELVGAGDFEAQMRCVYQNIGTALESEGLFYSNIAQMTTYLVGAERILDFYRVREVLFGTLFPDAKFPPNTLLVVNRLVRSEFLIEVQCTAAG